MKQVPLSSYPVLAKGLDPETEKIFLEDQNTVFLIDESIPLQNLPGVPVAAYSPLNNCLDLFEESAKVIRVVRRMMVSEEQKRGPMRVLPVERLQKELKGYKKQLSALSMKKGSPEYLQIDRHIRETVLQLYQYGVENED